MTLRTHGKVVPTHLHPPFNTLFAPNWQLASYLGEALDQLTIETIEPTANFLMQLAAVPGTDYATPQYRSDERVEFIELFFRDFLRRVGNLASSAVEPEQVRALAVPSALFFSSWLKARGRD
jgi:hypothetical protein